MNGEGIRRANAGRVKKNDGKLSVTPIATARSPQLAAGEPRGERRI